MNIKDTIDLHIFIFQRLFSTNQFSSLRLAQVFWALGKLNNL